MPTILRFRGFNIVIFVDDHPPAHIHAVGHDGHAAFLLGTTLGGVMLRGATRLPAAQVAALSKLVEENRDMLMQAWEEHHGGK